MSLSLSLSNPLEFISDFLSIVHTLSNPQSTCFYAALALTHCLTLLVLNLFLYQHVSRFNSPLSCAHFVRFLFSTDSCTGTPLTFWFATSVTDARISSQAINNYSQTVMQNELNKKSQLNSGFRYIDGRLVSLSNSTTSSNASEMRIYVFEGLLGVYVPSLIYWLTLSHSLTYPLSLTDLPSLIYWLTLSHSLTYLLSFTDLPSLAHRLTLPHLLTYPLSFTDLPFTFVIDTVISDDYMKLSSLD